MSTLSARHRNLHTLVFSPGTNRETSVQVALRQVTSAARVAQLKEQLGLTKGVTLLEGRLVEPLRTPEHLRAGVEALLVWAGRTGALRLEAYQGAITDHWRDRYGDKLVFSWRTDEIP